MHELTQPPDLAPPRLTTLRRRPRRPGVSLLSFRRLAVVPIAFLLAACSPTAQGTAPATPTDFAGIVAELAASGIGVDNAVDGDPGCPDQRLARTAIRFDAVGKDQATATHVYLYAFKDAATYSQLRSSIDACARTYATDPTAYATVDASPYVFAGPGPWAPAFKDALRAALQRAAAGG